MADRSRTPPTTPRVGGRRDRTTPRSRRTSPVNPENLPRQAPTTIRRRHETPRSTRSHARRPESPGGAAAAAAAGGDGAPDTGPPEDRRQDRLGTVDEEDEEEREAADMEVDDEDMFEDELADLHELPIVVDPNTDHRYAIPTRNHQEWTTHRRQECMRRAEWLTRKNFLRGRWVEPHEIIRQLKAEVPWQLLARRRSSDAFFDQLTATEGSRPCRFRNFLCTRTQRLVNSWLMSEDGARFIALQGNNRQPRWHEDAPQLPENADAATRARHNTTIRHHDPELYLNSFQMWIEATWLVPWQVALDYCADHRRKGVIRSCRHPPYAALRSVTQWLALRILFFWLERREDAGTNILSKDLLGRSFKSTFQDLDETTMAITFDAFPAERPRPWPGIDGGQNRTFLQGTVWSYDSTEPHVQGALTIDGGIARYNPQGGNPRAGRPSTAAELIARRTANAGAGRAADAGAGGAANVGTGVEVGEQSATPKKRCQCRVLPCRPRLCGCMKGGSPARCHPGCHHKDSMGRCGNMT